VIAPGAPVSGREAIAAFWQKTIDSGVKDVRLDTLEVESSGDLASETGSVRLVAKDGGQSQALRGRVEARRRLLAALPRHLERGVASSPLRLAPPRPPYARLAPRASHSRCTSSIYRTTPGRTRSPPRSASRRSVSSRR